MASLLLPVSAVVVGFRIADTEVRGGYCDDCRAGDVSTMRRDFCFYVHRDIEVAVSFVSRRFGAIFAVLLLTLVLLARALATLD